MTVKFETIVNNKFHDLIVDEIYAGGTFGNKKDDEKLIKKIEKLIFLIGGEENTDTKRFNENIAHDSLVILNGSEIPSLDPINTPPLVSEIKFKSNCSNLKGWEFNEKFQNLITSNSLLHSKIKKD
jgi:hypothetical protein